MTEHSRRLSFVVLSLLLLTAAAVASLMLGTRTIAPAEVWRAFTDFAGTDDHLTVRAIRVPRTVIGFAVGAALATAGALVQTLTRNPLAEPGILGVTSGASTAIVVAGALSGLDSQLARLAAAFAGALAATVLVYAVGRRSPVRLVLVGVALSAVLSGLTLGLRLALPDVFDRFRFWAVGSLAGREQLPLALPMAVLLVALACAVLLTRPLNALALGEQVAQTLGAGVQRTRALVVLVITLLAGTSTAVAGPVAFVGLIVPHVARRMARGSIPWLVGYSLVLGPALLVSADVIARLILPTGEVPVAVVTAFIGGPVLIWVVRRYGAATL